MWNWSSDISQATALWILYGYSLPAEAHHQGFKCRAIAQGSDIATSSVQKANDRQTEQDHRFRSPSLSTTTISARHLENGRRTSNIGRASARFKSRTGTQGCATENKRRLPKDRDYLFRRRRWQKPSKRYNGLVLNAVCTGFLTDRWQMFIVMRLYSSLSSRSP